MAWIVLGGNELSPVAIKTPLDMIAWLEAGGVDRVVLPPSALQRDLVEFLLETYPAITLEVH